MSAGKMDDMERDALRYRFLRDHDSTGIYRIGEVGVGLDELIDAEVEKQGGYDALFKPAGK